MNKFKNQLAQLSLKKPSTNYKNRAEQILIESNKQQSLFSWSYVLAIGLLISLAFNLNLYSKTNTKQQNNLVTKKTNAQKPVGKYSIQQGSMLDYGTYNDVVIIMENQL